MSFRSSHYSPRCVLLRLFTGSAPHRRNATTAWSKTSTGLPIAVTFYNASPPALAHFYVNCPCVEQPTGEYLSPKVICQDADLVVVRVPLDARLGTHVRYSDHFVYKVDNQRPRLDLLPKPLDQEAFGDNEIAILSCSDDNYVVAALEPALIFKPKFKLHLYRSTGNGKQGSWTSQVLPVDEPLRDKVCPPIPDSAERQMYHRTTKVITIGGDQGTIGWVDLWRGIVLCDVLSECPKLRDVPLPLPAEGNWERYLEGCPSYCRDITVNRRKGTVKYVEMEINYSAKGWVYCPLRKLRRRRSWTINTWRIHIRPVASSYKWHHHRTVHLANIRLPVGNEMLCKLLNLLVSTKHNKEEEATGSTLSLGGLYMAYPSLSIDNDDDVVHFSANGTCMGRKGSMEAVVSVDLRAKTLVGVAVHDTKRYIFFKPSFVASGISTDLKTEELHDRT
ncbi:hypothetical protein EJB05_07136, partial [Eragrostis curvula]